MTVFDAVADPTRRRLLRHLRQEGPLTLTQLAEPLPMSRQAVTKHLHVLKQAGLVQITRRGRERMHDLDDAPLRELYNWLEPYTQAWDVPDGAAGPAPGERGGHDTMKGPPGVHPTTQPIEKTIEFSAPPERVWRALTDPAELVQWFPDHASVDLRPGGNGSWAWDKHGKFAVKFEIVKPPHHLAWRWSRDSTVPVDVGVTTRVEFTLTRRHDGGTTLRLEETGFTTEKHYTQNVSGWKHELRELVEYLGRKE